MAVELLTVSAYARRRGCNEKAVRKAIDGGRITAIERDGKRLIDPEVADIQWERNTRPRVRPGDAAGAAPAPDAVATPADAADAAPTEPPAPVQPQLDDYQVNRRRIAAAEAEEAELRAARAAGRALDRDRAESAAFDSFRELRDAVFASMKSAARKVIGLTEVREVELALDDEVRQAFAGWEDRMRKRLLEAARP